MLFTLHNAHASTVHDLAAPRERLNGVLSVNTTTGVVCVALQPLRLTADGKRVEFKRIRFRRIWPIWAGQPQPVMFHCLDRLT